jgi:predicted DNA-binding transcriptional regulator AlpA
MLVRATPTESITPELLTLQQAADLCGVSARTLWTWATTGASPAPLKIHKGTVRYSRPAYVAWIAAGCQRVDGGHGNV